MCNSYECAEKIKDYAKTKGIAVGKLLADCGLNRDALSLMGRRGSWLLSNNLGKVAEYLDCSVDYLLGRTENPQSHKSQSLTTGDIKDNYNNVIGNVNSDIKITVSASGQSAALLEAFEKLDPFKQAKVLVYVEELEKSI